MEDIAMAKKTKHENLELRDNVWYFRKTYKKKTYHLRLSSDLSTAVKLKDDYLYELRHHGKIVSRGENEQVGDSQDGLLFGEFALMWAKNKKVDIKQI